MRCPKCGFDQETEVDVCRNCGYELTERSSSPGIQHQSKRALLEVTALFALSYPIAYLLGAALANAVVRLVPDDQSSDWVFASLIMAAAAVLGGAFCYGRYRRFARSARFWLDAIFLGIVTQMLMWMVLLAVGAIPEPWKLILAVPLGLVFSGIVLVCVWAGCVIRDAANAARRHP